MSTAEFNRYRGALEKLDLSRVSAWQESLCMRREGEWAVYYAPFEYLNPTAKIVIVGITPGLTQATNALMAAQRGLREGLEAREILRRAKVFASFSGPMRRYLVAMLDHIGVATLLGIGSCAQLFSDRSDLVHFTSVLRYPVTVSSENFSGTPAISKTPFLRTELERWMTEEVRQLQDALYIPLGPSATEALQWLVNQGRLNGECLLSGLPHPSGANAERIKYFLGQKDRAALSTKVSADKIDAARAGLLSQMARLQSIAE